jgi:succinate dehydrogenase / fumarate reductase membrane anchor subunit
VTALLSGSRAWLVQRLSALYLLGFLVYILLCVGLQDCRWTYDEWRAWILTTAMTVNVLLFFIALLLHAWVGLRDVILDYVHSSGSRIALLALVAASGIATGIWVLLILTLPG